MNDTNLTIRPMTIDDFEQVHSLWMEIHGFGIRSIDDSKEGVERFIRRNPTTSMVAVCDGKIVGAILCGHDGRRAGLYHVCVQENYRKHGIGQKLVERCLEALKAEKISKVNLIAFKQNEIGNRHSPTVIAAAITSRLDKARLPTHINIRAADTGLAKDSVVLLEQIRTLDKHRLRERAGQITAADQKRVDQALDVSLGLSSY